MKTTNAILSRSALLNRNTIDCTISATRNNLLDNECTPIKTSDEANCFGNPLGTSQILLNKPPCNRDRKISNKDALSSTKILHFFVFVFDSGVFQSLQHKLFSKLIRSET